MTPPAPIPFEARKGRTANPVQTTAIFGVLKGLKLSYGWTDHEGRVDRHPKLTRIGVQE